MEYLKSILTNRIAIAVIFITGLLLVIYFLFVKKAGGSRSNRDTLNRIGGEIDRLTGQQIASYTDSQYSSYADSLYNSMRYSMIDDDYPEAERILKLMNNQLDVLLLIEAYGTRTEHHFGIPVDGPKTLPEQVRDDLSDSRIQRINADYQAKGIDFRF